MTETLSTNVSLFAADSSSQGKRICKWHPKMQGNPTFHNKSKFYEFHNDHNHQTADCRQLKVKISQLIRRGHLKEFLSERGKAVVDKGKREDTPPLETLRIVNTILGRSEISGLIVSTTLSHICRVNLVIPDYEVRIQSMSTY